MSYEVQLKVVDRTELPTKISAFRLDVLAIKGPDGKVISYVAPRNVEIEAYAFIPFMYGYYFLDEEGKPLIQGAEEAEQLMFEREPKASDDRASQLIFGFIIGIGFGVALVLLYFKNA